MISGRSLLLYQFTRRAIRLTVVVIEVHHCYQLHNFIQCPSLEDMSTEDEIAGDHHCGFQRTTSTTDQVFCIYGILEKKWKYNERYVTYS
jgi:hypothetical protein